MTAATFLQTNFNTQDPTTYRGAIDGNFAVAAPIVDNFAPHAVATPNMTVQLDAGAIPGVGVIPTQVGLQTSVTLVAPAANQRKDIVYIDAVTGVIGVVTGTEAVSPVDPAIPSGKIPVARLAMVVAMTTVTNSIITDLRAPAMAVSSTGTVTAINASATITVGQSGTTFKLSGVSVTATLPTPVGNSGVRYRFFGSDASTQTISTPAATMINFPDGSTAATWGISNNQQIDIQSDGAVWRVLGMAGLQLGQTPATSDNTTKLATTAMVQAVKATLPTPIASVGATAPVQSSGGATPNISMPAASASVDGYMTAVAKAKLDGIAAGATVGVPQDVGVNGVGVIVLMYLSTSGALPGATIAGTYLYTTYFSAGTLVYVVGASPGTWRNVTNVNMATGDYGFFQRIA